MPELYVNTGRAAGEECSSTYEGRHITIEESLIVHPSHPADGFVDKGDPVLVGANIVGVAFDSASADTDYIAIDTEGIWFLNATATDEDGANAIAAGDELFLHKTTCILSKNSDKATHQRFGYALGDIAAGTDVVAVKVHWNPDDALELVGAAFLSIGTINNAREYRYRSTAVAGGIRGQYIALALNGACAGGEAGRHRTIVEAVGVSGGVHGCHDGLEFDADGTITGLGVGHRATFMGPDRALFATISGGMSELWAEGDSTDFGAATVHSIHRFVMGGDATGCATADNVFEFVNLSATQYEANTDTPAFALRCIINGNVRYIMVSEAQA